MCRRSCEKLRLSSLHITHVTADEVQCFFFALTVQQASLFDIRSDVVLRDFWLSAPVGITPVFFQLLESFMATLGSLYVPDINSNLTRQIKWCSLNLENHLTNQLHLIALIIIITSCKSLWRVLNTVFGGTWYFPFNYFLDKTATSTSPVLN